MEAIEKTLQNFKEEYFATEEDKIIVKLQILLPLLQNEFQEQADQAISSFDVLVHPSIKLNDAIEMCAKCLLQNGYVEEAFLVFCIPNKRGRSFVHCFHASEEAKKADSIVKGVKLSVRLLQESRINLRKLFMDSSSSSLAFLTRLMKELKEKNFVKDSQVLRNSTLATCLRSPWKDLVLKLADMDLATLENWADKELARHIEDPLYGTHTDCVNRILEKTLYQDEAAALDMYRKLVSQDSDDPRLPAVKSSGAAHIHSMYLQLGKYSESLHYLKEMIGLNPRYTGHLAKVVSSASVMLSNGCKDGVMESIEFYLRYMNKAFGKISLPAALPNILMQLLPPAQAFACLEKFNVRVNLKDNQFITLELMRLYVMGKDVDLLATAYIAFLKLDKKPTYQAGVDVILRLIKEDRKDLIQKVLIEMILRMEHPVVYMF
ncbi:uncharacterized protein LOC117334214 isoform X2 [Pecten maximus]|uniref:uncharacterized protein LOC117334214 isoform X2 n=1 Tax=Pecten maximus TaxID=6579 RepID=UPI0014586A7A|nr:uncharacterized protein LOC117334214 isoform X2 [Pecten maximus]